MNKELCLPYSLLIRTDWDKFPGADYTVGIDTVMPNGKTLQIGSAHYYGTNFSKPYDITYETESGEHILVHQTTLGMSERLLGAVIGIHADDVGLKLPPFIAPVQIVIIPIFKKDNAEEVLEVCTSVAAELKAAGIRVKVDERNDRPGSKFFDWEIKGVPLRFEIGGKDIENGVVTFARRDNGVKGTLGMDSLVSGSKLILGTITNDMLESARERRSGVIDDFRTMEGVDSIPDGRIVRIGWCGSPECGHAFEDKYDIKILGTPYHPEKWSGRCIVCGKEGVKPAYAARTL